MPSIGVTGTVGSGKSSALGILAELGADTISADRIGHEVLEDQAVKEAVVDLLGESIRREDGGLERSRIAESVFTDPEVLKRYDEIVHPPLLDRLRRWLERPRKRVAAVEAALIPEWGIESWFDEVWCLSCSDETALRRWNREEKIYWQIRTVQYAPQRKQEKAERVIDNERSQEELRRRIHQEWERFGRDRRR